MSRSKPWWRASKQQWYTKIDGIQIPLGVRNPNDEAAAWAALHQLVRAGQIQVSVGAPVPVSACPTQTTDPTIAELAEAWLEEGKLRWKPKTTKIMVRHTTPFVARFGQMRLSEITAERVIESSKVPTWSEATRRGYCDTALAILRSGGWVAPPTHKMRLPRKRSAGEKRIITAEQHWQIVGAARGEFRPFVRVLWELGCRPSELSGLTVAQVNWTDGIAVLVDHKTASQTGKDRVLYFTPAAMDVLRGQRELHARGYLFVGQRGERFSEMAVVKRFWDISNRLGFSICAYSYRHTFVTRSLLAGLTAAQVAELTGTSIQMIERHYGHLSRRSEMQEVLKRIA